MRYEHLRDKRLIDNLSYDPELHHSYKQKWRTEEEELIIKYSDFSLLELSELSGRTPTSVAVRKNKLKREGRLREG